MKQPPVPHGRVWSLARDYVESAEHLLDANRMQGAVVLAGLAGEILLKSFLIEEDLGGSVRTKRGHEFLDLVGKMTDADRQELTRCSKEIDPNIDLFKGLAQFGGVFVEARYRYEPDAMQVISSETIYFARHLCETVYLLGKRCGV